jgi:hypothetical protein
MKSLWNWLLGLCYTRKEADRALADLRSHKWVGQRRGGDPADAGSYEWVRYCEICGMEDTCEDPLPPCPGVEAQ